MATSTDNREEPSDDLEMIYEPIVEVVVAPRLGNDPIETQAEDDSEREVITNIFSTFLNWSCPEFPDLLDHWRREDIDFILMTAASDMSEESFRPDGAAIIRFLAASGYKDQPPLDEAGRPIERRVTALHLVDEARYSYDEHTDTVRRLFRDLFLIYDRFDVNYVDPSGWTHFRAACEFGFDDVVEKFLARGRLNPNCGHDPDTRLTHLQTAMYHEQWRVVELLLRHGADPNRPNEYGYALLHHVAMTLDDNPRKVELLLATCREHGTRVEVDARDELGETAFHHALENANLKIAEALLGHGADPNLARRSDGKTPLHIICDGLDLEHLQRFSGMGRGAEAIRAQLDARDRLGNTPLHLAVQWPDRQLVEPLLRLGADPNAANYLAETPLHKIGRRVPEDDDIEPTAAISMWKATVLALLRNGADPNLVDANGRLPLHLVCEALGGDALERFLEACDETRQQTEAAIDARDNEGRSPLHLAARWADGRTIELLLRRGADANARARDGSTPLHAICQRSTQEALKRYLHAAERYHEDDDRLLDTLFGVAEELNGEPVSIDARDGSGRTALQLAVANLKPNCVRALLSRGADLASFLFPTADYFGKAFESSDVEVARRRRRRPPALGIVTALRLASSALACVEQLESSGRYELDRADLLTIVKFFREHGLFRIRLRGHDDDDDDDDDDWRDPEFARKAKECAMTTCLSLHDLASVGHEAAARLVTHTEFCKFDLTAEGWKRDERRAIFLARLFARISARFFRRLEPLLDHRRWLRWLKDNEFYRTCLAAREREKGCRRAIKFL